MIRYDSQKISDLQNIQWQIINYWQQKEQLPNSLSDLEDPISGFVVPVDSQTKESYIYKKTDTLSFELCAEFNKTAETNGQNFRVAYPEFGGKLGENWQHGVGVVCFSRTIDPELYPVGK
jgi:hypothetical protein